MPGGFFKIGTNSNTDAIGSATLGESEMDTMRYLDISDNTGGTGSTTALNIPSTDVGYEQDLIVSNITGSYVAIIKQEVDNAWVELASREITATGLYTLEFTPATTNVKLDIINTNTGSYTHALRLTGPAASKDRDVLPLARTYTLCDRPRDSYRFGFNGKEKDNEIAGIGNFQDYGFREHDTRIGRFNSVDPLTKQFPYYTPFQFAGNSPIQAIDLDGKEEYYYQLKMYEENGNAYLNVVKVEENNWSLIPDAIEPNHYNLRDLDGKLFEFDFDNEKSLYEFANGKSLAELRELSQKEFDRRVGYAIGVTTALNLQNDIESIGDNYDGFDFDFPSVINLNKTKTVTISKSRYPESAKHVMDAQANGYPKSGILDRAGASARRKEALKGTKSEGGKDRDEYPPSDT